jgi:hypothetical protein
MDADRFDTLARSLVQTGSRRRALVATVAGSLAASVSLLGRMLPEAAKAKTKSASASPNATSVRNAKRATARSGAARTAGKSGQCKSKPAGTLCTAFAGGVCQNGTCVNLKADHANCGFLGHACAPT